MAKYAPLTSYLRRQNRAEVTLTFRDIERIVSGILPKAATTERWWRPESGATIMPQHLPLWMPGSSRSPRSAPRRCGLFAPTPAGARGRKPGGRRQTFDAVAPRRSAGRYGVGMMGGAGQGAAGPCGVDSSDEISRSVRRPSNRCRIQVRPGRSMSMQDDGDQRRDDE